MSAKVVHVIAGLETGGAEMVLYRLLAQLSTTGSDAVVVNLQSGGPVAAQIEDLGIPVIPLGMWRGVPDPSLVLQLARLLRRERPHVVQTWMYHSDLIGGLAARAAGSPAVAWGLHHSNLSPAFIKRSTLLTARTCARLSRRLPTAIVCCAESTMRLHAAIGYAAERMLVIPNGFDIDLFRPDPAAREAVRREIRLPPEAKLLGLVARFHAQKDHRTFLRAAALLRQERDDLHFLLCGGDVTWDNARLVAWIDEAGIRDRCHLLGQRTDVPAIQASLDLACLSSQGGEALPLAIGEAMAAGVPCVVTDVGDSALVVGETGRVVPPGDPAALAAACRAVLDLGDAEREALGRRARRRIAERYSLRESAGRYEALYECLAAGAAACAA